MDVLIWAIAVAAFIIIEIATVQLVSVWFAAGALITLMCTYFFELSMLQQVGIFVISSAVLVALTFPYLKSRRSKKHIGTNIELDVGKSAVVSKISTRKRVWAELRSAELTGAHSRSITSR